LGDGKGVQPLKTPVPFILKSSLPEQVAEETERELADPDSPGKPLET